jgi:tRNA(Ile)-lysidine synthase
VLSAVSEIDCNRIFKQFELAGSSVVVAAVSGGGDSLALLFLLKAHLDRQPGAPRLVAVTVDHGLRAEAADEARTVASLCRTHGIAHRTVRWIGTKPATGVPAAAREARYRLLAEAAASEGASLLLTGHTLDDQIETVEMRQARSANGSGDGRGLAGMAPATLYDGRMWILRPLLGTSRAALRDYLRGRSITWFDDPTNVDAAYERARLRAATAAGQDIKPARSRIDAAASERIALGEAAADLIRTHAELAAPGLIAVDRNFASGRDRDAAVYALRILLAAAGGTEQLPDVARVAALDDRLGRESFRATLSRAVVDTRRDTTFVRRENRGIAAGSGLAAGDIWDGRFRIGAPPAGAMIAAFGQANAAAMSASDAADSSAAGEAPASLRRAALAVEPALWRDGLCQGLAADAGAARRIIAPWARFLPSFDLEPARAVAELVGADIPPEPPLPGHKERKG